MRTKLLMPLALCACLNWLPTCYGQDVLFEETFDGELAAEWRAVGLDADDYRVVDGALEVRVKPVADGEPTPMLMVALPFSTDDIVVASVDVTMVSDPLKRGELAGLCLTHGEGSVFTVSKTNIDGYSVFAPGEPEFIGQPGEEGDPNLYAVKYWPADAGFGPLMLTVRDDYAYFQAGPSAEGEYRTFFHTAIQEHDVGMGFGLCVRGEPGDGERWVRFDNFEVKR